MKLKLLSVLLSLLSALSLAQKKDLYKGTFILNGTGTLDDTLAINTFVRLLKDGKNSEIIFIPTASSGIKLPNGYIFIPPKGDTTEKYVKAFEKELTLLFGVKKVSILHTRDKKVANSDIFVKPISEVSGVWINSGNAGRLADAFLGTKTQKEIEKLISRGGVVGGNSAGAIIMGSYVVRGWTEKPMLMAKGHDKGFNWIKGVAINPHLFTAKREYELISVIHHFPKLLGIGIDDYTTLLVKDNIFEVIGKSKVAIYDNIKHGDKWYYWLDPGSRFDLITRKKIQ
jgi:cyanophycinase